MRWLLCGDEVLRMADPGIRPLVNVSLVLASALTPLTKQATDRQRGLRAVQKSGQAHLFGPFFISSNGYGLFLKTARRRVHFDLAATQAEVASFAIRKRCAECDSVCGQTQNGFVQPLASRWAKPSCRRSGSLVCGCRAMSGTADRRCWNRLRSPTSTPSRRRVFVVEAWSDESTFYLFNDAQYTPRPGTERFHLDDFTFPPMDVRPIQRQWSMLCTTRNSSCALADSSLQKAGRAASAARFGCGICFEQQLVLQNADGTPHHIRPFWFHDGYVPDFSNPNSNAGGLPVANI